MKRHLLSAAGLALFLGLAAGSDPSKTGGTLTGPQMDQYAVEYLENNDMLEDGENVMVYYDATISLDGSEAAIVTDQRVMYHKNGRTQSILLTNIQSIETADGGAIGDIIDITPSDGSPAMHIEVAPLNGGDLFISELERAWAQAQ